MTRKALPLLFLAMSMPMFAQTTYTQTNKCDGSHIGYCGGATFTPTATLSYSTTLQHYGNQSFTGEATWNGTEYTDFRGTLTWLGYGNHYPYAIWEIKGTFDSGAYTVTEDFECYRTCGLQSNISGSVVGP